MEVEEREGWSSWTVSKMVAVCRVGEITILLAMRLAVDLILETKLVGPTLFRCPCPIEASAFHST